MKWPDKLSIKHVALAFITAQLVLVSLIGSFAAYQTRVVTQNLEQHNFNAARSELATAVQQLLDQTKEEAINLAHWDETRQQMVLPEYYAYWRDQRVYESGMLKSKLARAGLYDQSGALLATESATPSLPDRLQAGVSPHEPSSWLTNEAGTAVLYYEFPVYAEEQRQTLLGHGLIRLEFMQALLHYKQPHFTHVDSFNVVIQPGEKLATSELLSRLTFSAQTDPNQRLFQTILSRTLIAMFLLLAISALLGFVIYNRLLVRPLGRLSHDIDDMQHGHFNPKLSSSQPMRVNELETIRRSLCDYQQQLRVLHGSLEHQNREFHSQARQDALTGCHNRRAYDEDWENFRKK